MAIEVAMTSITELIPEWFAHGLEQANIAIDDQAEFEAWLRHDYRPIAGGWQY
jgi:hypothetical protein